MYASIDLPCQKNVNTKDSGKLMLGSVLSSHKPSILSMYHQKASVLSSQKPSILNMYRRQKNMHGEYATAFI